MTPEDGRGIRCVLLALLANMSALRSVSTALLHSATQSLQSYTFGGQKEFSLVRANELGCELLPPNAACNAVDNCRSSVPATLEIPKYPLGSARKGSYGVIKRATAHTALR